VELLVLPLPRAEQIPANQFLERVPHLVGRLHVTGRLLVRRVRRLNPASVPQGQGELFAVYRYHAAFTDSTLTLVEAEATHRGHAIVEQVIADLKNCALARRPRGKPGRPAEQPRPPTHPPTHPQKIGFSRI